MGPASTITLADAARLVRRCAYAQTSDKRQADDRARQRIKYAVRTGRLPRPDKRNCFPRDQFLWWAEKKWPNVRQFVKVPPRPQVSVTTDLVLRWTIAGPPELPDDLEALRRRCLEEIHSRERCEKQLKKALRELERYRAAGAERDRKRETVRPKLSKAGKRGGRGRPL